MQSELITCNTEKSAIYFLHFYILIFYDPCMWIILAACFLFFAFQSISVTYIRLNISLLFFLNLFSLPSFYLFSLYCGQRFDGSRVFIVTFNYLYISIPSVLFCVMTLIYFVSISVVVSNRFNYCTVILFLFDALNVKITSHKTVLKFISWNELIIIWH